MGLVNIFSMTISFISMVVISIVSAVTWMLIRKKHDDINTRIKWTMWVYIVLSVVSIMVSIILLVVIPFDYGCIFDGYDAISTYTFLSLSVGIINIIILTGILISISIIKAVQSMHPDVVDKELRWPIWITIVMCVIGITLLTIIVIANGNCVTFSN